MDKEKVTEIKKALECISGLCKDDRTFTCYSCVISQNFTEKTACKEALTLINELEKEKTEQLKQFAERLKEKFNDTEYRAKTKRKTISVEELKAQMDWILHEVVIKNIDETLKEQQQ